MPDVFDGSSLEALDDSLGAGRQVDAEIAEALGEVDPRGAVQGTGKQVPLPPKRLFGEVRGNQLWAWSEVNGRIYDQPHIASATEAAMLQRGIKVPQAGFQQLGQTVTEEPKTFWQRIPPWVKWTGGVVGLVGGTLLAEHFVVPKVAEMLSREKEEEYEEEEENVIPPRMQGSREIEDLARRQRMLAARRPNEGEDEEEDEEDEI